MTILDFKCTSSSAVVAFIESSDTAQESLREAFEHGCLQEELTKLAHFVGPRENRNILDIDTKGTAMKVIHEGLSIKIDVSMGIQMILKRNVTIANSDIVKAVLGVEEGDVLSLDMTHRQLSYESSQVRLVIENRGRYMMPERELVRVVDTPSRVAWSTRTRNCVAAQQGWQCNMCNVLLASCYDIDHVVPLSKGGADAYSNLQALCVPCHRNKTASERSKGPLLLPPTS